MMFVCLRLLLGDLKSNERISISQSFSLDRPSPEEHEQVTPQAR